jgi:hypothetical protein
MHRHHQQSRPVTRTVRTLLVTPPRPFNECRTHHMIHFLLPGLPPCFYGSAAFPLGAASCGSRLFLESRYGPAPVFRTPRPRGGPARRSARSAVRLTCLELCSRCSPCSPRLASVRRTTTARVGPGERDQVCGMLNVAPGTMGSPRPTIGSPMAPMAPHSLCPEILKQSQSGLHSLSTPAEL